MTSPALPKIIALCGRPKSGKSEVAEMLERDYGYLVVDDGYPMRDFAVRHFGLTWEDVSTQDGKTKLVSLPKGTFTVRQILGELGNALEEKFGADVIPLMAFTQIRKKLEIDPDLRFVMPCCRRAQGFFWRANGGVVMEVENTYVLPSGNAFDLYDKAAVDITIPNNFMLGVNDPATGRKNLAGSLDITLRNLNAWPRAA